MKQTTYRTTFALDEDTNRRLGYLAASWHVSRAEVVRRAVAMADRKTKTSVRAGDVLRKLHAEGGGMVREKAEDYLREVRATRDNWRGDT